ncbi:MAG TPA: AAA family ATPase, partial [Amnibacterium sp.]
MTMDDGSRRALINGLLERHEELAELDRVVDAAGGGSGSLLVIEGPAGIGKSRLLAAARARTPGALALQAQGSEFDSHSPYFLAAQLFDGAVAKATGAQRELLFAGPARLAAPLFDGGAPFTGDGEAVLRGLFWLAVNLAAGRGAPGNGPLLLTVDDAQWADRASLRFVLHLAARLDGLPLALIVGIRTGGMEQVSDLLDAVRGLPSARVLRPDPLSPAAVAAIVEQDLPGAAPPFAQACARVTGGNPFLVHELINALRADHVSPSEDAVGAVERLVPAGVARAVLLRLGRLPTPAQRLAVAVAILGGGHVPLTRAAHLAELAPEAAEQAADALTAANVLTAGEPLSFMHPLIGSAVYADVPAFARARAHKAAADLLSAEAAPSHVIAAHLMLTRPAADPETVATLRDAAVRARAQGEPDSAARLLRRAHAERPVGGNRFDLLLELAQAEAEAGEHGAGEHVAEALTLAADPASIVSALTVQARTCYAEGDHTGTLQAAEAALDRLDPDAPEAEALLAYYFAAGTFHAPSRVRTQARLGAVIQAASEGRLPSEPALLAHVALHFALSGQPSQRVREVADRALAADPLIDAATHGMPLSLVVQALCSVDDLQGGETAATNAIIAARQRGSVLAYALASYHRAIPRYHRGALVDALADIDQVYMVREEGWVGADGWTAQLSTLLHLERGDLPAARRSTRLGAAVSRDSIDHPVVLYGRAQLALADGRPDAALEDALAAGHLLAAGFGIDHPGLFAWRCTGALAAHRLGQNELAGQLAGQALEQARAFGVPRPLAHALRTSARLAPVA